MKAKQLIEELIKLVDEHGDLEITIPEDPPCYIQVGGLYLAEPDIIVLYPKENGYRY